MKKRTLQLFFIQLIILTEISFSQSNFHTWTETTVQDFSDNQLTNLVVTDKSGGEVQLPHPLRKTVEDYNDNSVFRFVARDSSGNFVRAWFQSSNIYIKKYSSDGNEISGSIQVNEQNESPHNEFDIRIAILNNGTSIAIWRSTNMSWYGQIFSNDLNKIGSSFKINEGISEYAACVFADNINHTFGIIYSLNLTTNYKLFFQRRDTIGNKIVDKVYLNPDYITKYELTPAAVGDDKGFWVAWDGSNGDNSYALDLYLRRFNFNGEPDGNASIVNDNLLMQQGGADLYVDDKTNLFVVWLDGRDGVEPITSPQNNIYGQVFNQKGNRIGSNVRINTFGYNKGNDLPDVDYSDGEFRISWRYWDETYRRYLIYNNVWKFDPKDYGEMTSSIFNTGPSGSEFNKISWKYNSNPKTEIKFRIKTGKSVEDLQNSSWYGPSDISGFYTDAIGQKINSKHNADCYIQYKAYFHADSIYSPSLSEVTISYLPNDTTAPSAPKNLAAKANHSSIDLSWHLNKETDIKEYFIYRRITSSKYDNNKFIVSGKTSVFKDTTAKTGTFYFYVIVANDSANNKSVYSNEVYAKPFGINVYVSENGNSNGDGTISFPYKTIQEGFDNAFCGDTIKVLSGNYNDSFIMKEGISLIGSGVEECLINVLVKAVNDCVIKRLTFTKSLICSSASPIITENIFKGTAASYMPAIQLIYSSSPTITKNFINECNLGINIIYYCQPIIKNNIIQSTDVGINLGMSTKAIIINNTIVTKKLTTLNLDSNTSSTIENNILITLDKNAWAYPKADPDYNIKLYNDFWNENVPTTFVPSTNIFLNPQFVNMDLQDYHLLDSSPCKDAGNPDLSYNDIDGSRNDMGAYGGPGPIKESITSTLTKSIYVSTLSGYPEDTISVIISLDTNVGLAAANFVLEYDNSLLEFQDAQLTTATQNFTLEKQFKSSNEISFSLISNSGTQSSYGNILKINFVVSSNAKSNDASPLILKDVSLFDVNLNEIDISSITDGAFVINSVMEGKNITFVDSKFTGNESGSRKNPFNTISEGINKAVAGDTVFVLGGDYNEPITMKEGINLIGSGASVTKIIFSYDNMGLVFYNIQKAEVSGFTIKTDDTHFFAPLIECISSSPVIKKNRFEAERSMDDMISFRKNSNALFENNYIKDIYVDMVESSLTIKNNIIEVNNSSAIHCFKSISPLIINNILIGNDGGETVVIAKSNPILRNNLIYCSGGGFGLAIYESDGSKIYNNLILDKSLSGTGIKLLNSSNSEIINNSIITDGKGIEELSSTSTYFNNIVMNNNNFGLQLSPASIYNYNDVWNNQINYYVIEPGNNDISFDPLFVDTLKGDYRLSPNSPCKNAGNPDPKYNNPDGSRNDIGAYGGPYADSTRLNSNGSSLLIDSLNASSADTFQVTISGNDLKGVTEIEFTLTFDPTLLKMINAYSGEITKGFSLQKSVLNSSSINLCLSSNKSLPDSNGELIKLFFETKTNLSTTTSLHFDSAKVKDESTYSRYIYNLKDGQIKITSGINDLSNEVIPKNYSLYQNFPNPFNPTTTIRFDIPKEGKVSIVIYDVLGRKVTTLLNEFKKPGSYEIDWKATDLTNGFSSGVYFYQLQTSDFIQSKKMILIK